MSNFFNDIKLQCNRVFPHIESLNQADFHTKLGFIKPTTSLYHSICYFSSKTYNPYFHDYENNKKTE